jgi:hypothetical protein
MELIGQMDYILQYELIRHLILVMVVARLVFKPVFAILGKYVELTIEEEDNKKLHRLMSSKGYKLAVFVVDMMASVKLPKLKGKR